MSEWKNFLNHLIETNIIHPVNKSNKIFKLNIKLGENKYLSLNKMIHSIDINNQEFKNEINNSSPYEIFYSIVKNNSKYSGFEKNRKNMVR